jgi:hypothetical protein
LRNCYSILFSILILAQAFHLPVLSVWLNVHQEYIAANLCENRFEPALMCSGRCYINAQTAEAIGQQNDQEEAPLTASLDWQRSLSPFLLSTSPSFENTTQKKSIHNFHTPPLYNYLYIKGVFHPPC